MTESVADGGIGGSQRRASQDAKRLWVCIPVIVEPEPGERAQFAGRIPIDLRVDLIAMLPPGCRSQQVLPEPKRPRALLVRIRPSSRCQQRLNARVNLVRRNDVAHKRDP